MEFILFNVSNAVSNAIRRTVACELLVYCLYCEYDDIKTNDAHVIPEMLQKRFKMLPIDQSCSIDAKFELNVSNTTVDTLDVKTSDFVAKNGKKTLPLNGTFTFLSLNPGKFIKISNIKVISGYGFREGDGMLALVSNASSISQDVEPLNAYENTGVPSRMADPRVWKVSFNTNGTMPPNEIVKYACDNIIARINNITDLLYSVDTNDDQYILNIHGESDTIGNL